MKTKLNNWRIVVKKSFDVFSAPELITQHLQGCPIGAHEGVSLLSGPIVGIDGEFVVTQGGSKYALGTVHPEYEKQFPDAEARVLATLRNLNK